MHLIYKRPDIFYFPLRSNFLKASNFALIAERGQLLGDHYLEIYLNDPRYTHRPLKDWFQSFNRCLSSQGIRSDFKFLISGDEGLTGYVH